MPKFRKKPVVIEAMRVPPKCTDDNIGEHGAIAVWLQMRNADFEIANNDGEIDILTLEGTMRAANGDWIICGVAGELYPCKPDIFAATYEPIEGGAQ